MNEKKSTSFSGDAKEIEHYFKKAVSYENNDCYLIQVPGKKNFGHCICIWGSESIAYKYNWQIQHMFDKKKISAIYGNYWKELIDLKIQTFSTGICLNITGNM